MPLLPCSLKPLGGAHYMISPQGTLCRLSSLRVTTGSDYYYKKLDAFGVDAGKSVAAKIQRETIRLKAKHQLSEEQTVSQGAPTIQQPAEATPPVQSCDQAPSKHPTPQAVSFDPSNVYLAPDRGRKIVFDNFDFKQHVHNMTENHQNTDIHWVTHLAVENRVTGGHLSDKKPAIRNLLDMENGMCLPNRHEHTIQRENYITLTERMITDLPCLQFLKSVVCKHIPHQYSKEMSEKSEMVGSSPYTIFLYAPINVML